MRVFDRKIKYFKKMKVLLKVVFKFVRNETNFKENNITHKALKYCLKA